MANIVIAYGNYADTATLSGGSYTAGMPRDNMKTDRLYLGARTTDAALANTKMIADLGVARSLEFAILGPTNLSVGYKVRVRGAPTSGFASGYDSGWLTPTITAADIDAERGVNVVVQFGAAQTYRYWQIELDDSAGNTAGYVQIGKLFLPQLLKPSVNYAPGSNGLSWEDRSLHDETWGGAEKHGHRRARRVFNFQIPFLPEVEAFSSVARFFRTVGFDTLTFVIPDPAATASVMQERAFWARIRQMDPITQAQFLTAGVGLTASEWF